MKKIFNLSLVLTLMIVGLASCSNDPEFTDTKVTYYATITLEGEDFMVVDKGSDFTDPGYSAEMGGEDVTNQLVVESDVDTSTSGIYGINYTIVNEDGFSTSAHRTVVVLDPNDAVEGIYTVDKAASYRDYGGSISAYKGYFDILVLGNGDGTYSVDDLLGGWYCQGAGYGDAYAMQAIVGVEDDGSLTLYDSLVPGWGDSADDLRGTFDVATGTFNYEVDYAGVMTFHITMSK